MRVSMSPSGSFISIFDSSPARLDHAGPLALVAHPAERDAAHLELAVEGTRTARHLATVAHARRRRIARQLGELQPRRKAVLVAKIRIGRRRLQFRALGGVLLSQPLAAVILLDRARLRH